MLLGERIPLGAFDRKGEKRFWLERGKRKEGNVVRSLWSKMSVSGNLCIVLGKSLPPSKPQCPHV